MYSRFSSPATRTAGEEQDIRVAQMFGSVQKADKILVLIGYGLSRTFKGAAQLQVLTYWNVCGSVRSHQS